MPLDLATALAQTTQQVRPNVTHVLGWVTAYTSATVTVRLEGDTTTFTVPKIRNYSPSAGDVALLINVKGALYALGALNASATTPDDDDGGDAPPPSGTRTRTIRPGFTGTWRTGIGWRNDTYDVLQGDWTGGGVNHGAAYYGKGASSVSGTAVSGSVRIRRAPGGSVSPQRPLIRLLQHSNKPNGFPTTFGEPLRGPLMRVADEAKISLPKWWVQRLIDGQNGGIGVGTPTTTAYIGLLGRAQWGPSMELTIKYK